ncbi:MAG TPA: rhodanese-like domain-containing protein, partial [Myxococcaceae bacterium]|nr:rhodanese-like domain-containing protein [Myxococcaceae bacterium]
MSHPVDERIFHPKWRKALRMNSTSIPELPVEFVAEQGRSLHIIDVRDREELQDLVGHIPGSIWVPLARIAEVPAKLGRHTPIILVSRRGNRAGTAAQYLRALGMDSVAVLAGGLLAWRALGYSTSRHERVFDRPLAPVAPVSSEPSGALTKADIERHVGDLTQVRWLRLAALIVNGKRSCVDGRDDQGVIGTPGGDAGELVLAFGCLERVMGRELTDEAVETLLARELDTFGRFYMHTDTHAWTKCLAAMKSDPRLSSAVPPDANDADWVALANRAPVEARPALLEHFQDPAHLGCGHLRLMLTKPE